MGTGFSSRGGEGGGKRSGLFSHSLFNFGNISFALEIMVKLPLPRT